MERQVERQVGQGDGCLLFDSVNATEVSDVSAVDFIYRCRIFWSVVLAVIFRLLVC